MAALIILAIAVAVGWQYFREARSPQPDAGPSPTATPNYDAARQQMEALPVHGWDRVSDFQRFRFGEAWSDDVNVEFGHNGCNTRDDILRRDLADLQVRPGTCFAQSGVLHDPYTGVTVDFVRGPGTSSTVQIDHLVSLSDAWYKGARALGRPAPPRLRQRSAQPAGGGRKVNFDKAFRDVGSWLPPNARLSVRLRRPRGRGEDGLPAVGVGQREGRHAPGAAGLLARQLDQPQPGVSAWVIGTSCASCGTSSSSSSSRTTAISRACGSRSTSVRS